MNNNPFNEGSLKKIWLKYFNNSKDGESFNFIKNVSFIKNKRLPIYVNIGVNLTSGITYKFSKDDCTDYKGKVFVIRDIPSYHNLEDFNNDGALKLKKLFQYEGYTTEVSNYESLDQYMKSVFKSNSRYKFRRNIERLELCFDIKYTMYYGKISSEELECVFDVFYTLLEKRYSDKQERCGELDSNLWSYYVELAYIMINNKKASLFVVYDNNKPIGITFNYHFDSILIEALTVFDIDYYKFNIGHTTIYKLLEWSFNNNITLFDYTHGDFDYKKRWSDNRYQKHHHLIYDSSSVLCNILAFGIKKKFDFKRILRDKKIIKKYNDFVYKWSNINAKKSTRQDRFKIDLIDKEDLDYNQSDLINIYDENQMSLRKAIFDYYYKSPELILNVEFYKCNSSENCFYAIGLKNNLRLIKLSINK